MTRPCLPYPSLQEMNPIPYQLILLCDHLVVKDKSQAKPITTLKEDVADRIGFEEDVMVATSIDVTTIEITTLLWVILGMETMMDEQGDRIAMAQITLLLNVSNNTITL